MRGYSAIAFMSPFLISLFVIFYSMQKYRGNLLRIKPYVITAFIFGIIIPLAFITNSLIYINQLYNLIPAILLFSLFGMFLANMISGYYTRFSYISDDEYKKHTFIDGYKIEKVINIPKFKRINALFVLVHVITPLSTLVALLCLIASESNIYLYISIGLMLMGAYSYMLYFIWFRWYFKCHHCKNPIYSTRVEDGRRLYFYIMLRVFRYHRFTCMYCHAHYQLGDRDIITEKGLVIKSKHEADFIVEKKR